MMTIGIKKYLVTKLTIFKGKLQNDDIKIIQKLHNLVHLNLTNNYLNGILAKYFQQLKKLQKLVLINNPLFGWTRVFLLSTEILFPPSLINLNLSYSNISINTENISLFNNLKYLKNLDLSSTQIDYLNNTLFKNLYYLEYLNLTNITMNKPNYNFKLFKNLNSIKILQTSKIYYCCLLDLYHSINVCKIQNRRLSYSLLCKNLIKPFSLKSEKKN